ncbi:MAG: hypothetical protein K0S47_2768 [Herbinix sp.]|jgi:hypothetical protein|nr:hypothetical protein [Herbinix sp.]
MGNQEHFCTCSARDCKFHPVNHESGCDLCIQKNLKAGEIPGCFFRLVSEDLSELNEFTIESFADFVHIKKGSKSNI